MEIGDWFEGLNEVNTYKVVKFLDDTRVSCNVYVYGRFVGITSEYVNTLLQMRKLTPLEKELM